MRFTTILELKSTSEQSQPVFEKNKYRAHVLHVIKLGMQKSNPQMYELLYNKGSVQKAFASSIYLPAVSYGEKGSKYVTIKKNNGKYTIEYTWSSSDTFLSEVYLSTFLYLSTQKDIKFTKDWNVNVHIPKIEYEQPIVTDTIMMQTVSPIICSRRFTERTKNKTEFYSVENSLQKFESQLRYTLHQELSKINNDFGDYRKITFNEPIEQMIDNLTIIPVETHKTVQSSYEYIMEGTAGVFCLSGNPELLQYIIKSGLGTRRGLGFGLLKLI